MKSIGIWYEYEILKKQFEFKDLSLTELAYAYSWQQNYSTPLKFSIFWLNK